MKQKYRQKRNSSEEAKEMNKKRDWACKKKPE